MLSYTAFGVYTSSTSQDEKPILSGTIRGFQVLMVIYLLHHHGNLLYTAQLWKYIREYWPISSLVNSMT